MSIEGNVSVKAALLGNHREVKCLYVDEKKHDKDTAWILHRAEERNIPVQKMKRDEIDKLAAGRTHGGLIAEAGSRRLQTKEETLTENSFVVLLEGVEDPFNLGYVMRSLYSAGCTGLLLRKRDWANGESVIIKSSAGASEYLPVVMSEDLAADVRWYKQHGLKCFAAMRKDAIDLYQGDYRQPVLMAVGGEMRGLSKGVLAEMDQNMYIPYANDFRNALNAAGASAVIGFEIYRQRH